MSAYHDETGHHGQGSVSCWWFRWHDACRPGCYIVTAGWSVGWPNLHAVIDDFGTLVEVKR